MKTLSTTHAVYIVLNLCLLACTSLYAGDSTLHRFAFNLSYSENIAVSQSMRESIAEFRRDLYLSYNSKGYPFRPSEVASARSLSSQLSYVLENNRSALFFGFYYSRFFSDTLAPVRNSDSWPRDEAEMNIWSLQLGAEYDLRSRDQAFNVYVKGAILASMVGGHTRVTTVFPNDFAFTTTTKVPYVGRIGASADLGLCYTLPGTAIVIAGGAEYMLINLLGKSYVPFTQQAPKDDLYERELNDAKNPDDPSDAARTIDFLRIHLGLEIRL